MDFGEFLMKQMKGGIGGKKKFKTVAKLVPEDVVKFLDLQRRKDNLLKYSKKVASKITSDVDRVWSEVRDKYDLHGEGFSNLTYEEGSGEIKAEIEEKEKEEISDDEN